MLGGDWKQVEFFNHTIRVTSHERVNDIPAPHTDFNVEDLESGHL